MWLLPYITHEGALLFFTDTEIKRLKLNGFLTHHPLSHAAIRKVFSLRDTDGKDQKVWRFWDSDAIPTELLPLLGSFELFYGHWKWAWHNVVERSQLASLIVYSTDSAWTEAAWAELTRRQHIQVYLKTILISSGAPLQARAWNIWLQVGYSKRELNFVVGDSRITSSIRHHASALLQRSP